MKSLSTLIPALFAVCSISAQAAIVVPVAWKHSTVFSANRFASNLGNANGMNATQTTLYNQNTNAYAVNSPGETANADFKEWLTGSTNVSAALTAGKIWVIADLGDSYTLNTIRLWNFQWDNGNATTSSPLSNRGINQFDVFVRNAAADTSDGTVGGAAINAQGATSGDANSGTAFSLGTSNPWVAATGLQNQNLAQSPNLDTYAGVSFNFAPNTTARFVAIRVDSYHGGLGVGLGKIRIDAVPEPNAAALIGFFGVLVLLRGRR